MQAITLTKKQQKKALSTKRNKKETIKNVVVQTQPKFWPLIDENESIELGTILDECLPKMRKERTRIPYKKIKDIPIEERKSFRENLATNQTPNDSQTLAERVGFVMGVNSVTKMLEQGDALAVLITDNGVKTLVSHLVDLCVLRNVPILVEPHLRIITKSRCSVSSVAIGISKKCLKSGKLERIAKKIEEIFKKHPAPHNHVYSNCDNHEFVEKKIGNLEQIEEKAKNYHLSQTATGTRAFIPPLSSSSQDSSPRIVSDTNDGFIAFATTGESPPAKVAKIQKSLKAYKSLIVHQLKGNRKREQTKKGGEQRKKKQR